MTTTIRSMNETDIPGVTNVLKSALPLDPITKDIIREKTTNAKDATQCTNLVLEKDGAVIGAAQGVSGERRGVPHGWIRLFGIHADHQRDGVGTELLDALEEKLFQNGAEKITTFDCPASYLSPGLDFRYTAAYCFFTRRGYTKLHDNLNLICPVTQKHDDLQPEIERLAAAGFTIRRMQDGDRDKVVAFLNENDWPSWIHEIDAGCENDTKTVWLCLQDDKVVGFCAAEGNNKGTGWFGPMGVSPACRGQRIGNVVCSLSLADIGALGHKEAIIPWVGPVHFYWRVCGARIDRTFWVYEKDRPQKDQ